MPAPCKFSGELLESGDHSHISQPPWGRIPLRTIALHCCHLRRKHLLSFAGGKTRLVQRSLAEELARPVSRGSSFGFWRQFPNQHASTKQAPLMWLRYDRGPPRTWELIRGAVARPGAVTLAAGLALRSFGAGSLRCDLVSEVGGKNRLPIQRTCLRNQMPCMIHPRPASKTMSKLLWMQGLSIKPFWIFRFSVLQHTASIICSEGDCYSGSSSREHWWLRPPRCWAHALRPK